jgi:ribonuclease-3 family protein
MMFSITMEASGMTDYFHLDMNREGLLALSSLGLAHLGDSVFEVMVRSWLCLHGKARPKQLHQATVEYVAAPAQAAAMERLLPFLSEEEADVFRRGRNSAPHYVPQSATRGEYQAATGLEALFGWLYLQGRTQRLNELFALVMRDAD